MTAEQFTRQIKRVRYKETNIWIIGTVRYRYRSALIKNVVQELYKKNILWTWTLTVVTKIYYPNLPIKMNIILAVAVVVVFSWEELESCFLAPRPPCFPPAQVAEDTGRQS